MRTEDDARGMWGQTLDMWDDTADWKFFTRVKKTGKIVFLKLE
jgi:hypothetical protein